MSLDDEKRSAQDQIEISQGQPLGSEAVFNGDAE